MDRIELVIPDLNWEGLQPTAAQVIAAGVFWDVHGYRPVLHPADMFPHDCARCREAIAKMDQPAKPSGDAEHGAGDPYYYRDR